MPRDLGSRLLSMTLLVLSCVGVAFAGTPVDLAPITGGGIVWENRGQPEFQGYALDVDGSGNTIVAAGGVAVSNETSQWYVRALDRQTGAPKWEERFGPMTFGVAKDVAVSGNRAFVAGWTYLRVVGFTFDTRAYDLDTGSVVWSQEVRLGDGCLDEHPGFGRCVAKSIAVDDGRVFVVGHVTWTANQSDFAVFAYDATTGARLWNSVTDPTGTGAFDYAWAVKAVGGSVYVVGEIGDMSALLVRAYDAATGAIRWEKQLPGARDDTIKDTLAVDGTSVFVSGSDADGHFAVWAYDQATGTPVWSDRVDDGLAGFAYGLALDTEGSWGPRLYAVGIVGCDPVTGVDCELAIRAYDPATGLVWARTDVARGGDWAFPVSVRTTGDRVFVAASELLQDGQYHARLRTYLPGDGSQVSDIAFDRGSQPYGFLDGLFTLDGELYTSGILFTSPIGSGDWVVRRYKMR